MFNFALSILAHGASQPHLSITAIFVHLNGVPHTTSAVKCRPEGPFSFLFLLLARFGRLTLALTFGVNPSSERVLEPQGDDVHDEHADGQRNTSRLAKDEGGSQKVHRRAPVHRGRCHVEGEASHHLVHQDAKVVAQEGARDAQAPRRRDDKDVAEDEQGVSGSLRVQRLQKRVRWLLRQGRLVQPIAEEAQREDGHGEGIAGRVGSAPKQPGQDLVVVFCRMA